MRFVICARVQSCRRRLCQHKQPHVETALCMLKRDLGGKLSYRGLSSPKCHDQECIALDSIVAIKGEQNLPEKSIMKEE